MMYRQLPAAFKKLLTIEPHEWDDLVARAALLGVRVRDQGKWIAFTLIDPKPFVPFHTPEVRQVSSSMYYLEDALRVMARHNGRVHYGSVTSPEAGNGTNIPR